MAYEIGDFVTTNNSSGDELSNIDSSSFTPDAGSALVAFVFYYDFGTPTVTLSDTAGGNDTWTEVGTVLAQGAANKVRAFYLLNASASATTVRAAFNSTIQYPTLAVVEVKGIATSSALAGDAAQIQGGPGSGTDALSSGNTGTLTGQPAAVIGYHLEPGTFNPAPTVGSGYTNIGTVALGSSPGSRMQHKRVTATTAVASTATSPNGAGTFMSRVVVLLEATGGGAVARVLGGPFAGAFQRH